ncbi:MAG TPA: BatD family protein [Treponemataceae bacterium]|nr:BatD family protein [Treponemataceae bacterium]
MRNRSSLLYRFLPALAFALFVARPASAQNISASWGLDQAEVAVGQTLTLTLEVQGADDVDVPELSVKGADVQFRGGGPRNSTSITMINGKTTKNVSKAWVGSWSIRCAAEGLYHIDSQDITAGGRLVRLPAVIWRAAPAQTDSRFELRQTLSQEASVPGVEIGYTLVWYIAESVQNPQFSIPALDNPDLELIESSLAVPQNADTFQIRYGSRVLSGVRTLERMQGRDWTALSISFRFKPAKSGVYDLSATLVSFEGAVGSRQARDFFGNIVNEPVYKGLTAQANPLKLTVRELPAAGKPDPFSGLIGALSLDWKESGAAECDVGEPVRRTLVLSGVLNKPDLDLDYMVTSALSGSDFAVAADPATAGAEDNAMTRTYVFRAKRAGKLTVPKLTLNYFDPRTEQYGTVSTKVLTFAVASSSGAARTGSAGALSGTASDKPPSVPSAVSPADGLLPVGNLADVYPNPDRAPTGDPLSLPALPLVPWWAWLLPGLVPSLIIAPAGLWRHSRLRAFRRERTAWRALLGPLPDSAESDALRAALVAGRERFVALDALLRSSPLWRDRLESTGKLALFAAEKDAWDTARFAPPESEESRWDVRWDRFRAEMEGWK